MSPHFIFSVALSGKPIANDSAQLTFGLQNNGKIDSWKESKLRILTLQPPKFAAECLVFVDCFFLK